MSTRNLARLAGVLYLLVAIFGGFAQMGARAGVLVSGDAAATAANIRASEAVFRFGFVADVINVVTFLGVALVLYTILAPVSRSWSRAFLAFNAIAVAIMGVDLVNHAGALIVATDPSYGATLGAGAADALAGLFLELHRYGYLVAEIFFGLWLLPLGVVVYRSGYFPRVLGAGLVIGSFAYLASFAIDMVSPGFSSSLAVLVAMPAALAEVSFLLWLLVRGANAAPEAAARVPGTARLGAEVAS
jgi:hypothetical protein